VAGLADTHDTMKTALDHSAGQAQFSYQAREPVVPSKSGGWPAPAQGRAPVSSLQSEESPAQSGDEFLDPGRFVVGRDLVSFDRVEEICRQARAIGGFLRRKFGAPANHV
jgi:hypothetical protein